MECKISVTGVFCVFESSLTEGSQECFRSFKYTIISITGVISVCYLSVTHVVIHGGKSDIGSVRSVRMLGKSRTPVAG